MSNIEYVKINYEIYTGNDTMILWCFKKKLNIKNSLMFFKVNHQSLCQTNI